MKALMDIQQELKAPKSQYNSFGKYNYRSAENILEAVKPLLAKYGCVLTLTDGIEAFGDRLFLRAVATIRHAETGEDVNTVAYAEIPPEKKGMDASQITGTASSYARKYALNGLFCIDDTKDADTDEYYERTHREEKKPKAKAAPASDEEANESERRVFMETCAKWGLDATSVLAHVGWKAGKMTVKQYNDAMHYIESVAL